jgi:hypothetical protein
VTQAITGLGGVGKSQLAARYVREHVDEYDVVAWIGAEDGEIADLSELAVELGLPVARLTPAPRAASALRAGHLTRTRGSGSAATRLRLTQNTTTRRALLNS